MTLREQFESGVSVWRDPERCVAFMKGRVALYAILRALGIGEGDEVVVPGFTCFVVPAAICYTGATPVYHDIDRATLQGDPERAERAITERTRAVIVQHNFGALAPWGRLREICRERGIFLVEDCAHAMGSPGEDGPAGTLGVAAFASLQWSKPTTTGLGGIARLNDAALAGEVRRLAQTEFAEPSRFVTGYLDALSIAYRRWFRASWYWRIQDAYRWVGAHGLVRGSSSPGEFRRAVMPPGYRQRFGASRGRNLDAALDGLPDLLLHRRTIYDAYLGQFGDTTPGVPATDPGAALRFPVLVENREALLEEARRQRVELGDWFNAPLHPVEADPSAFGYAPGLCPEAEWVTRRIVNLPTHGGIGSEEAARIARFVRDRAVFSGDPQETREDRGSPSALR